MGVRWVRIKKFAELTGYTEKAVYQKIHTSVWAEEREYRHGPDNVILIDLEAYDKWASGTPVAASRC